MLDSDLTGDIYLQFLQNELPRLLKKTQLHLYPQYDGVPPLGGRVVEVGRE
jgi:hypothetical protein